MAECREIEPLRWPLVAKFYKANGHKGKPCGDDRVLALLKQGEIVAAVRLSPQPQGCLLLRGLWTAQTLRNQGLGSELLLQVHNRFADQPIWCYPYAHLDGFYRRNGFSSYPAAQAPDPIRQRWTRYRAKGHDYLLMAYLPATLNGH